jgi:hypothetical protein
LDGGRYNSACECCAGRTLTCLTCWVGGIARHAESDTPRRVGGLMSPEGADHLSPGERPGFQNPFAFSCKPLKGRQSFLGGADCCRTGVGGLYLAPSGLVHVTGDLPDPGLRRCEKFGWGRPLRSARPTIAPENAHLKGVRQPTHTGFFTPSLAWALLI